MADLTRLRAIIVDYASVAVPLASAIHHLSPKASKQTLLDAQSVTSAAEWLSRAPLNLYGEVISQAGITAGDFSRMADQLDEVSAARAATYANAMVTADQEWDREVRDHYATEVSVHAAGAARVSAQSSAEFAVLDLLSASGYAGIDDAVSAVADIRRAVRGSFVTHSRQLARSRHSVSCKFTTADGAVHIALTPWCLSRKAAIAVAAVLLSPLRRRVVEQKMLARARTVHSFAARTSLQAVRDLASPALALLTRYTYEASKLAFVDNDGAVVQGVGSRLPHVAVAFAAVFTRGKGDPLRSLAHSRVDAARSLGDMPIHQTLSDYYQYAADPVSALGLVSRYLVTAREERAASEWGDRLNKGAVLGYLARERNRHDRNTAACVNRLEEMAVSCGGGGDSADVVYVVEWGGEINQAVVLAAAAVSGLNVALDVADSGIDVPGADVYGGADDPPHHYQLYLATAKSRNLPRMPVVEYQAGTPLVAKLTAVYEAMGGKESRVRLVYLNGGVTQVMDTPVNICTDASARLAAVRVLAGSVPVSYVAAEVMLPPACHHVVADGPEHAIADGFRGDTACEQCMSHYRALATVSNLLVDGNYRLVKQRSAFGHNMHFAVETATTLDPDGVEDTMATLDAVVACNLLRNADYPDQPPPLARGRDPTSESLRELLKPSIAGVYRVLSGGDVRAMGVATAGSVAASVE